MHFCPRIAISIHYYWLFIFHLCLDVSSTGNDDSDEILTDRLAKRIAQLSEAFEHVRRARVEMSTTDAVESALKKHESQQTVVQSTELVQYVPVLWIDDLHCLDPVFAVALVQSLFLFPFPVIITVSERDGLTRIMSGTRSS